MDIAHFGVEEWLNKWEKKATYDISQSSIEALTLEELIGLDGTTVADFFENLSKESLDYGWIEGSDEFKSLVASLYKHVEPNTILQTNDATGANFLVLYALIEPGDHVVSMLPTYQPLYDIPLSLGAAVDFVELKEKDHWQLDLDALQSKLTAKTKMICLNSANNPTGTLLDIPTLKAIVEMARKVDAYILIDEVYAPLTGKGEFMSIVDLYEKDIATNSLSKTYSLPGVRIGWTASSKEIADIFRKYRDYTMICGGVLSDELAVHALKSKDKIIERNRKIIKENLFILNQWVEKEPLVSLVPPNYVSTAFIKLDISQEDEAFCIDLLEETGVLLVPGTAFDFPRYARLGYCCKQETLTKALELLSGFLRKFDK
ncbi:Aspartate/methionine/tyrosine aminotransferase [Carnobacterium iners]|uniref:Aspartate/methionine/tyrosine aminotransferase n=1 Tax=Carnobacterium iners TaxID=1073423 RepID=A0A1X7MW51_9LACT|nr:aminotransferase [Carnobacterium iners]SEL21186.1 Aspartate/methionine/tyrosine aminotransferase [Carnobacterium iners]SMH28606.1 Aspartate/methionine/tyrosine aminotransferase [Carnobacterium iners]